MGHMKNLYIDICNANDGKIPTELTIEDANRMHKWQIFNWTEYVQKLDKEIKEKKFDISIDARENKKEEEAF
tara:strand:- start:109 stop:324 length:216 start_codon:yes stop_codon:yes gene_type:complete